MFFRKKRYSDVEGYDRISRMIEDRQTDDGAAVDDAFEEETVLLTRGSRETPSRDTGVGREQSVDDDIEESVTLVRPPERSAPRVTPPAAPLPDPRPTGTVTSELRTPAESWSAPTGDGPAAPSADQTATFAPLPVEEGRGTPPADFALGIAGAQAGAVSLVAKDAVWEGKLVCTGNVRIEGTLRGEVETTGTLFVAAEARVEASVRARNVTLAGEIHGDVRCEERLEILPGGAAHGEVDTSVLVVHEGAFIESRFQMRSELAAATAR